DGIRDKLVTGVQTCALPIWLCGITSDDEVVGLGRILALNHAVQAGEAQLVNLAVLCLYGIVDRAMAEFFCKEILRTRSDTRLHKIGRASCRERGEIAVVECT